MLTSLIRFSLRNRKLVLLGSGAVGLLGVLSLTRLPIDAVPDITNIQVVVNTKTRALDPEKIEALVTRPIENEMTGLPLLEEIRSISKYGLSQVTLVFKDGTDRYFARQQVSERLQNVRDVLPDGISPELAPVTTGLGEVFMYAVEADPDSAIGKLPEVEQLTELRTIQDYTIRPFLKRIAGVADVDSNGGYTKQIHINFFPDKLERVGISAEMLVSRLQTLGENFGGGYIQRNNEQIIVRTVPGIDNIEQLKEFPLGTNISGRPIRLSEVAEIRADHSLRVGAATRAGKETILGTVLMRVGANSREVAEESESALGSIALPAGVRVVSLYSRSYLVDATIRTVEKSLFEGAILVIGVLLLLLGHLRAALIVASAIPLSMLFAARGMEMFGISANLMSLGAIDFGLLVDGSVVLIENVLKRLQARKGSLNADEKLKLIESAASEVVGSVVFGLFLIMLVYIPVLSLEGIEGKMFRPMASTVLLALAGSLLIAVFVMPVLAYLFIPVPKRASDESVHETRLFRYATRLYLPLLHFSLQKRSATIGIALGTSVVAGGLLLFMGADFVPQLDEGDLVVTLARSPSEGIDHSVAVQRTVEDRIEEFPEVERVFSRLGTPESATDPMGVNLADTFIILKKDRSQWKHPNKDALFEGIRKSLEVLKEEQEISATQPIEMRFNEILEGSRADVTLRILGPNLDTLLNLLGEAQKILEPIPGLESAEMDALTALKKSPMLDIVHDYPSITRYGLTVENVNRLVELSMNGQEVGSYFENSLRFPVVVHLDESLREKAQVIENLPVGLTHGGTIPLSKLARFDQNDRVTTIARWWGERYAAISLNLKDRDVSSFVQEAQRSVANNLRLPQGYRLYWGGQFRNLSRAKLRLYVIVPLTILGVFFLLLRVLGSPLDTLLVFIAVPFSTVGGILLLFARGIPLSISAAVGFIALIGIALLNSIVLITVFRQLKQAGASAREAAEQGAMARFRPVLMTALVAGLGFAPMALNSGIGAEVQRPLATVVIGGLITSTVLTLVLLPTLYAWRGDR